jgi:hypothetical protein
VDCAERRGALKDWWMECGGVLLAMGASFVRHRLSSVAGAPLAAAGAAADWLANGGLTLAFWIVTVRTAWLGLSLTMQCVSGYHESARKITNLHRNAPPESVTAAGGASPSALRAYA